MNIRESSYGYWSSTRAFVWVAAGACIGIGNVARLPYLMGENGGVLFLAAYVLALLLVGLPLLVTDWMLGRWMRDDLVSGFNRLAETAQARRIWRGLGILILTTAALVLSYYSVIAGWSLAYAFRATGSALSGMDAEQARSTFLYLAQDPERGLSWHTIFMVVACIIVAHGVREGIERAALRLVPAAVLLGLLLCIYAMARGDSAAALDYLLRPDFERFGWRSALEALHQAFFTLGLGIGVMMTLGSYLDTRTPLKRVALTVIGIDLTFSLVAGTAVYALILHAQLPPTSGLALLFQVLPRALPEGLAGAVVAVSFYVMLFMITMTSATVLLETVTRYLMERMRTTRVFAAAAGSIGIWTLGVPTLLSFSVIQDVHVFGLNFFEVAQWLTVSVFAPLAALLVCIFAARIMPREFAQTALGESRGWMFSAWSLFLRFPARLALIVLLVYSLGLLDWLLKLWSTP